MDKFKCPKEFEDPICPKCRFVLPDVQTWGSSQDETDEEFGVFRNFLWFKYPYGMSEELKKTVSKNSRGCHEWKKKNIATACGCAGTAYCKCGYNENFCYPTGSYKCPFCGRDVKGVVQPIKLDMI